MVPIDHGVLSSETLHCSAASGSTGARVNLEFSAVIGHATLRVMAQPKDPLSLRFGYWVAVHRDQLRTWWAISIIAVDVLLLMYFVVTFTQYSFTTVRTVALVGEMAAPLVTPSLRATLSPRDLVAGTAVAIERGIGRYDLAAPVSNPNPQWAATEVRYRFTYGATTHEEKTVLWPGSESFLTQLNVGLKVPPAGTIPQVEVTAVQWQRPDTPTRFSEVAFPLSQPVLRPVTTVAGSAATRLTATVTNNSVYSFRSVRLTVVLRQGNTVVAAGEVSIEAFKSLEKRPLEVTWLATIPGNAAVSAYPAINLLDRTVYQ